MTDASADPVFEPLPGYREYPPGEMEARSRAFAAEMQRRRTTRHFSDRPVSRSVIEACLEAAETAPYLIAVFAERFGLTAAGVRRTHYYVQESVGIATGFLLAALHHAGLVALTHTPNPMGFLAEVLERPVNERPVMLVVTGYPADGARVPLLRRKPLSEIATFR
jgi:nitroreductase